MLAEPRVTTTEPTAEVPQSTVFCADDADLIIRAAGEFNFRVHKCILSLVSPIFKDMFAIPQPTTDTPSTLPHIDVQDSPKTWDNILRTIYPMPNPTIDKLDDLESLLLTAEKYEMQFVIDSHKRSLENREFIRENPLRLYAITCAGGLEDQAKYVARNAELFAVIRRPQDNDLNRLTVGFYHRLITFLVERDHEWDRRLSKPLPPPHPQCRCEKNREVFVEEVKKDLKIWNLRAEEIYFKALENPRRLASVCGTQRPCVFLASEMKLFIDGMIQERETICNKFMW